MRHVWTQVETAVLRAAYPDTPTAALAASLGLTVQQVYHKAQALGLRKSAAYLAGPHACRLRRGDGVGAQHRFEPGLVPWNKGMKGWCAPGSERTQFKPGELRGAAQRNYVPIGSLRLTKGGLLERKITDDPALYPARRWVAVHRLVWEAANGPIPPGHMVRFRPGRHTVVAEEITADRLELVSFVENMRRNTLHRYPPQIVHAIQLRGALIRKINARKDKGDGQKHG
jgi:HNH endonuclease